LLILQKNISKTFVETQKMLIFATVIEKKLTLFNYRTFFKKKVKIKQDLYLNGRK